MTSLFIAAALAATSPVSYNAEEHSVTFTATAVGMPTSAQIEFLFAGKDSDHDYETLFLTDADVGEIAKAFEKAGIPTGKPIDAASARLWPVGDELEMTPAFDTLIKETFGEPLVPISYTGGKRDASGIPDASTNMPLAVFALYSMPQSLIQFDDALDQSATYGRFRPAAEFTKGERRAFTFKWKGKSLNKPVTPVFEPGKLPEAFAALKKTAEEGPELDVTPAFSGELALSEAITAANALSVLDSRKVKMNGYKEGELFFQAYLPKESWRDRTQRLCQPPEVHMKADGSCVVTEILEDWSGEGTLDPKLTIVEHPFKSDAEAAAKIGELSEKTQTVLVYAAPATQLNRIFALRKAIGRFILNWYVYTEQ